MRTIRYTGARVGAPDVIRVVGYGAVSKGETLEVPDGSEDSFLATGNWELDSPEAEEAAPVDPEATVDEPKPRKKKKPTPDPVDQGENPEDKE